MKKRSRVKSLKAAKKSVITVARKRATKKDPKKAALRRKIHRNRPPHKRILLHPVTGMLLLCIGVLLVGLTIHAFGDNYDITAAVLAPVPSDPATISDPADQTHFTTTPITVSGSCPENTYVELERNNVFSGSAVCGPTQTTYQIQTDLSLGSNSLVAQVYNITDQPGPASSPITVWLDNPIPSPPAPTPATPPQTVQVTTQDNIPHNSDVVTTVSSYVTERGTAPPYSYVVITFHSNPLICATYADSSGNWSCTLDQPLPDGLHTVMVTATTPEGKILTLPTFYIHVSSRLKALQVARSVTAPFLITSDYNYQVRTSGTSFNLNLGLSGGVSPYAVTILWGDHTSSTVARSDSANFSASHTYILSSGTQHIYTVKIEAADNRGNTAFLQLSEIVRYGGYRIPIIGSLTPNGSSGGWFWLIWPTYIVVVLMALSFWLGERQEYYNLFKHRIVRHHRHS